MTAVRADVAAMLRDGATYAEIKRQCHVSDGLIARVRHTLGIPLPPDRTKRTPGELAALEDQAVAMLQGGATYAEIHRTLRVALTRIAQLRKQHRIPVPDHDRGAGRRHTVEQAFTLHTEPTDGGHLLWTGPVSNRDTHFTASGRRYNARHIAFRNHHGRDPEGRLRRTCNQPACIAGAHHTDHRIRAANTRADKAFTAIFGQDT